LLARMAAYTVIARMPEPHMLRLYNTLTKREEEFKPLNTGDGDSPVTFYSCGPTVYDYAHIGNFRSFLNADVLRRTLELVGHDVKQVMNITDVGHMTDDTSPDATGEDRMQVAGRRLLEAKKSGRLPPGAAEVNPNDPYAIADFYADAFLEDARALGVKIAFDQQAHPELMPRPTRYIPQIIAMIQKLLERDHAYVARDGVLYFDVMSFPEYGKLSGNTPDTIRAGEGGRVDAANQAMKKHPADFMLWKPDAKHIMKWESPWGAGYPGWHIECSVMARSLLGDEIDIHSGGEDNIFPHHECEIAQSCGATGHDVFARFWFHTRFLLVEGDKMSKSKGNFFTLRDLLEKGASPAAVRLEIIKTHYRSNANFTLQGLADSQRMIERWARARETLEERARAKPPSGPNGAGGPLAAALPEFVDALCNDLNVAGAVGVLNEAIGRMSGVDRLDARAELDALLKMNSVLGVLDLQREGSAEAGGLDVPLIESKVAQRNDARKARDFKRADALRDELLAMNIEIKDGPDGTTWARVVK
jgi:cysteinyl-tRNA synthetase